MRDENRQASAARDAPTVLGNDPWAQYYNLEGFTDAALTTDIDWAPEYAIERVADRAAQFGHRITMFTTHRSDLCDTPPAHCEIGLHPDYTRPERRAWADVLPTLKGMYPNAVGMRSHTNLFGQRTAEAAHACGLHYDISYLLWNRPYCQAFRDYSGLVRFTYHWEDGTHWYMNRPLTWDGIELTGPGLKIFNVHPISIYLNSPTAAHCRAVQKRYPDLANAPQSEVDAQVNRTERGIADLWVELLEDLATRGVRTHLLRDMTAAGGVVSLD